MDKKNQNNPKMNMPRFNMNWIYGIVIVTLIALYMRGGGAANSSVTTETSYDQFKTMVMKGYASKIVVNKEQNKLRMYVKPEHIRDVFKQGSDKTGKDHAVNVEFGSVDKVEQFVDEARAQKKFTGEYQYDNQKENNMINMIIYNLLPFVLIIGIWIFIMRRMSGGSGGAGGVFNVGKSKAKMYEKGGELNVTFKDVAGQVGAKQEVREIVDF